MFYVQQNNSGLSNIKAYPVISSNIVPAFVMPVYSNPLYNGFDTVQINNTQYRNAVSGGWFFRLVNMIQPAINKKAGLSDDDYRTTLADTLGCRAEYLAPIVGPNELKTNLVKYKKEDFSAGDVTSEDFGKRFKRAVDGGLIANLHNHTTLSDGNLDVETFLNHAASYADKVAKIRTEKGIKSDLPCFIVAITDHDNMDGAKEAVMLISREPEKYKNLKVVLGLEQSACIKTDFLSRPVTIEVLGYCLNPFDKDTNRFLDDITNHRIDEAKKGIAEINKHGYNFSLAEIKKDRSADIAVQRTRSRGFLHFLKEYLDKATNKQHSSELSAIFDENVTGNLVPVEKAMEVITKCPTGVFGLAHPGRVELDKNIIPSKVNAPIGNDKAQQAMYMLLSRLKELGITAAEAHYAYSEDHYDSKYDKELLENIDKCCDKLGLIKTGGQDGHENLFTRCGDVKYIRNGRKYDGLSENDMNYLLGLPVSQQAS